MSSSKMVIAGGGMVAGYAAKKMVELGLKPGELTIFSADSSLPYERPPLSKTFLAGKDTEESILINPASFYKDHGIDVRLGQTISSVDPAQQHLTLAGGEEFGFEKLVIATGARPRKLDIPGANPERVLYLRSMNDSKKIRETASGAKNAVVIGGGFIGMEVAAVLTQKGVGVTMVLNEDRIWKKFFTPEMSTFFENYYVARGVKFAKNTGVSAVEGSSAVLQNGQNAPCDFIVAGIGASPITDLLTGSGIELGDGVLVNEYLETNFPDILAAGDIANYQDVLFGKRRRAEHWDNAVSHGEYLAKSLMGERKPFQHVPYFFSDVFDLSYEFWGDTADADEVVYRGDVSTSSFSAWWVKDKRLIAAFAMNRPDEERTGAPQWIESKQAIDVLVLKNAPELTSAVR